MSLRKHDYDFRRSAARIFLSGQAQTVILHGNVGDYFYLWPEHAGEGFPNGNYVTLLDFLRARWSRDPEVVLIAYEIGGPIQFVRPEDRRLVQEAWEKYRTRELFNENLEGPNLITIEEAECRAKDEFPRTLRDAVGQPAVALRFMEKMCEVSRSSTDEDPLRNHRIVILLEDADMLIPQDELTRLSDKDRHRTVLCREWFCDPGFMTGKDAVVLVAESASQINERVAKLPQMLRVEIPAPDLDARTHYIAWFNRCQDTGRKIKLWGSQNDLAEYSAGLNLHALRQMLVRATYEDRELTMKDVTEQVEAYILSQLGEGTVEFHRPHHTLSAVVGCKQVVTFLRQTVIPRMRSKGSQALSGVAVSGPIGAGKTFIFEGLAAELGMPVLILKNLRSKWYGGTDVILERLERVLKSLSKVGIFVDEADTVFGGVGQDVHETERRLTGKIQGWMSDPRLKGRVIWILMTARVQNLSADIRRPGRVGNLIIPILDPVGEDAKDFIRWVLKNYVDAPAEDSEEWKCIQVATDKFSAAQYAALREELDAEVEFRREKGNVDVKLTVGDVIAILEEQLGADIRIEREIQRLYALLNCTRKSLLPDGQALSREDVEKLKQQWLQEVRRLERELAA